MASVEQIWQLWSGKPASALLRYALALKQCSSDMEANAVKRKSTKSTLHRIASLSPAHVKEQRCRVLANPESVARFHVHFIVETAHL